LRLPDGAAVEVFDNAGNTAGGTLGYPDDRQAVVAVESVRPAGPAGARLTVASAVPKAERADWLVEKLSELGVARWLPLATERSVVLPSGTGKRQRWMRIATESAKQSRRDGVMAIDELTPLPAAIAATGQRTHGCTSEAWAWVLSTVGDARPVAKVLVSPLPAELTVFIGPEGGWTDAELRQFTTARIVSVRLGDTVLRVETAAIAAAAIVAGMSERE
ncbi:MAG TPA: RsmE family RNA methyltransferase, partial [Tepidisphaeraceae bacterium]|nr:RsmE family RNA methyltransferase [Tepidisphaeraceae bacterium]